uniref:uncharacterized protein LOC118546456 n=1 Tax=Halichoerus grypus TaxID=9711 RepID=UPI0016591F2C|nr:uncharacterized protein LOC118546456 [Halichoerus grypus]
MFSSPSERQAGFLWSLSTRGEEPSRETCRGQALTDTAQTRQAGSCPDPWKGRLDANSQQTWVPTRLVSHHRQPETAVRGDRAAGLSHCWGCGRGEWVFYEILDPGNHPGKVTVEASSWLGDIYLLNMTLPIPQLRVAWTRHRCHITGPPLTALGGFPLSCCCQSQCCSPVSPVSCQDPLPYVLGLIDSALARVLGSGRESHSSC